MVQQIERLSRYVPSVTGSLKLNASGVIDKVMLAVYLNVGKC
jgi:hypothetical protein